MRKYTGGSFGTPGLRVGALGEVEILLPQPPGLSEYLRSSSWNRGCSRMGSHKGSRRRVWTLQPEGKDRHFWSVLARDAGACREATQAGEPEECLFPAEEEYLALAKWSGEHLPDGSVVVTRKPRIFYVMSGMKALSIPFTTDPDELLQLAGAGGAGYVTLDLMDSVSRYYVLPVLRDRLPFVWAIVEEGSHGEMGTQILGILDEGERLGEGDPSALYVCPEGWLREVPRGRVAPGPWEIPLLMSRGAGL